jgi:hypothetical protein
VYSRWTGDHPSEDELLEAFADELSHRDHNDLVRGLR